MRIITLAEWYAEGTEKFGEDEMRWMFECPSCGNIQCPEDFRKFKDRGADPSDAYFNCIGRFVGGGDAFAQDKPPCDYTMGGLIRLAKTTVVDEEGKEHLVFEFASKSKPSTPVTKAFRSSEKKIEKVNRTEPLPQVADLNPPHRGMTPYECKMICTSPEIPLQQKVYYRIIYESLLRPFEVLYLKIEDWDRVQCLVTAHKVKQKYDRKNQVYLPSHPRTAKITENTNQILKKLVGNRKKGPVFVTQNGQPFQDKRYMNREINMHARLLGIQQEFGETRAGRKIRLVTLMALRKAGERHHDNNGGSRKLSALIAGHTMGTKERHYDETDFEPVWESMEKNHPAFVEGW